MSKSVFQGALMASTALVALSLSCATVRANGYDILEVSAPPPGQSETISSSQTWDRVLVGISNGETGTLTVGAGATLTTTGDGATIASTYTAGGIIGRNSGSTGTAILSGAGATWTDSSNFLIVGDSGSGTLQMSAGTTLNTNGVLIGNGVGSSGALTLNGAGAAWNNSVSVEVGRAGTGSIVVSGGASVVNQQALRVGQGTGYVDQWATGTGSVTVTGAGSRWVNSLVSGTHVQIATEAGAVGSLTVTDGGSFETSAGGLYAGAGATITVTGVGSALLVGTAHATPPVDWNDGDGWLSAGDSTVVISGGAKLDADASYIDGPAGTGSILVTGEGTTWHNWLNIFVGGNGNGVATTGHATVADGAVATSYTAAAGTDAGSTGTLLITGKGTLFQVLSRDGFAGNFRAGSSGNGTVTVQDGATLSAVNVIIADFAGSTGVLNIGAAEGDAPVAPGTVFGTNGVRFGDGDATLVFNHTSSGLTFDNLLSGTGGAIRHLAGVTDFTVDSPSFTGTLDLLGGTVKLNADIAGLDVNVGAGGTLGGNGTLKSLTVAQGGTVSPGNSIGTLVVNGDVNLVPGAVYVVELGSAGNSDLITATGQALLNGATVHLVPVDAEASYKLPQVYTIVAATGGVDGSFGRVTTESLFLSVDVDDLSSAINVVISVSDNAFASVAASANQRGTAAALSRLPQSGVPLRLYNSVLFLTSASEARWAYDQLSGEVHASTQSLFIEQSSLIRGALNDRLRAAQGGVGASSGPVVGWEGMPSLAYAAPGAVEGADASMALKAVALPATTERFAFWSTAFGNWGEMDGNANAASLSNSTGGFLIGVDGVVGEGWRLGLAGGYSYTDFSISGRNASGNSDNWHIALYGGNVWGPLALRTGLAYTWHDISTNRSVAFTGFADSLSADYNAGTVQAFGELGYRIDAMGVAFEPFANLAYVSLSQDGYTERGGAAALTGGSETMDTTFSTLGLRLSKEVSFGATTATLRGALGWRHAFGDSSPTVSQAFVGWDAFTVTGVPIAEDAAVLEAGVDMLITPSATLGIAYTGQYGDGVTENGFNARLSVKF